MIWYQVWQLQDKVDCPNTKTIYIFFYKYLLWWATSSEFYLCNLCQRNQCNVQCESSWRSVFWFPFALEWQVFLLLSVGGAVLLFYNLMQMLQKLGIHRATCSSQILNWRRETMTRSVNTPDLCLWAKAKCHEVGLLHQNNRTEQAWPILAQLWAHMLTQINIHYIFKLIFMTQLHGCFFN